MSSLAAIGIGTYMLVANVLASPSASAISKSALKSFLIVAQLKMGGSGEIAAPAEFATVTEG